MSGNWIKKIGSYTAVLGALGVLWTAAQWCKGTTDKQDEQTKREDAIIQRLDKLREDTASMRGYSVYQSRRIDTLDANRGLINRYVHAPQVPMPQPDMVKQPSLQKDDHSLSNDPFLAKDKPSTSLFAIQ